MPLEQIWTGQSSRGKAPLPRLEPCTTIEEALARGNVSEIKRLVKSGRAAFDAQSCNIAAYHGHVECLEYCATRGAVVTQDAALYAARQGHIRVLQFVCERVKTRIDVETCWRMIREAFCNDNVDVLEYMEKNRALDAFPPEMGLFLDQLGKDVRDVREECAKRRLRVKRRVGKEEEEEEEEEEGEDGYADADGIDDDEYSAREDEEDAERSAYDTDDIDINDLDEYCRPMRQYLLREEDDEDDDFDVDDRGASYGSSIQASDDDETHNQHQSF